MAFVDREISLTFTKADGLFEQTQVNQITVSGLRVQCNIINVGKVTLGTAQLRIYGLSPDRIQDLSALNSAFMALRHIELEISAGNAGEPLQLIFSGQVFTSQIDFNNPPDSVLVVIAQAGLLQNTIPANPSSFPATSDHITILQTLAKSMGLHFEASGPPVQLRTQYLQGNNWDQAIRCADAAGVNIMIENGTLVVWPRMGVRNNANAAQIPLISASTGMVGYPGYSEIGIDIATMFNPFVRIGMYVAVESMLPFANGTWIAFLVRHELESQMPNGKWFTYFNGQPTITPL